MRTNNTQGFCDRTMRPPAGRKQRISTSPRTPTKFKKTFVFPTTNTDTNTDGSESCIVPHHETSVITTPTREYESKITTITPYKMTRMDEDHQLDLEDRDERDQENESDESDGPHLLSDVSSQLRASAKRIQSQLDILVVGISSNWEERQKALYQLAYRVRTCSSAGGAGGAREDEEEKCSYVLTFQGTSSPTSILRKMERAMVSSLKDTRPRIVQASCDVICAVVDALSPKDMTEGSSSR